MELILGVDVGNNATKVWVKDRAPFLIPTFIDMVANANLWEHEMEPMEHLDLEIFESSKEEYKGRAFYGHLAAMTRNGKPMPVRSNKARNPQVARTLLCALAVSVAKELDAMRARDRKALLAETEDGVLRVNIHLGCGLPMDTWLDPNDRRHFRRSLRTGHRVRFVSTPKWSEYGDIELNIKSMIVAAEGTAILYGAVFDDQGRAVARELAAGTVMINDLGANTHDAPIYRAMKLDNILSRSFDSRMAEELDAIGQQIRLEYSRALNRQQVAEALFVNNMSLPNGALPPIDIRRLAEPRFRDLADEYAGRIIDALNASNYHLSDVLMAGGGSVVVRPYLEDALVSRGLPKPFPFRLHWLEQGQYGNANGYLKLIQEDVVKKKGQAS